MGFSLTTALLLVLLGVAVGAFGTLVGAGGGFVLTPVLLILYPHDSAQTLTAISLVVVFFNALSGSVAYFRLRRIDFRSGIPFALATIPGAIGGALLVSVVSRHLFDLVIAATIGGLAAWLALGGGRREHAPAGVNAPIMRGSDIVQARGETYNWRVNHSARGKDWTGKASLTR